MKRPSKTNILVITPWSYRDGLIQAYTLPYLEIISSIIDGDIYLVTEEKDEMKLSPQEKQVAIAKLDKHRIHWISLKYRPFGTTAVIKKALQTGQLLWLVRQKSISHIHAWCLPGGVLGYCISLISGRPLIIDSFEPHAEAQVENGTWTRKSFGFKVLWWFEKKMANHASTLIYTTRNMIVYASEKYGAYDPKEFIKPACVDVEKFASAPRKDEALLTDLGLEAKVVGVYAGKLGGIYHDVELFELAREAHKFWNGRFKLLMLTTDSRARIESFCSRANCPPEIVVSLFVPHHEIPLHMKLADFGITLVRSVPTKKYCTPIKDGEYWASGLPIVITSDIGDDSDLVKVFETGCVLDKLDKLSFQKCLTQLESCIGVSETAVRSKNLAKTNRGFHAAHNVYQRIYGN